MAEASRSPKAVSPWAKRARPNGKVYPGQQRGSRATPSDVRYGGSSAVWKGACVRHQRQLLRRFCPAARRAQEAQAYFSLGWRGSPTQSMRLPRRLLPAPLSLNRRSNSATVLRLRFPSGSLTLLTISQMHLRLANRGVRRFPGQSSADQPRRNKRANSTAVPPRFLSSVPGS